MFQKLPHVIGIFFAIESKVRTSIFGIVVYIGFFLYLNTNRLSSGSMRSSILLRRLLSVSRSLYVIEAASRRSFEKSVSETSRTVTSSEHAIIVAERGLLSRRDISPKKLPSGITPRDWGLSEKELSYIVFIFCKIFVCC